MNNAVSYRLNIIRLVAAHLVLVGHGFSFFQLTIFKDVEYFAPLQQVGVVLLFFISGYLTMHTFMTKRMDFGQFVKNRFIRIYPPLILSLLFILAVDGIWLLIDSESYRYHNAFSIRHFIGSIFLLQDLPYYDIINSFGSGRPLWTLAIEWWLYLFTAYIFYKIIPLATNKKLNLSHILIVLLLGIIPLHSLTYGRGRVAFVWLIGCIVYLLFDRVIIKTFDDNIKNKLYHLSLKVLSLSILILILWFWKNAYREWVYLAVFIVGVLFLNKNEESRCFGRGALKRLAAYTYPLYLCHYTICAFVRRFSEYSNLTNLIISILLSNIVAIIFYYFIEMCLKKYTRKPLI
ncbi:MAG: acyltransferase [Lachnospiraceae bacterium]|nr:acyltransferase [Lachnospiraceae bacterium]